MSSAKTVKKIFGRDVGGLICGYMWECVICNDLFVGQARHCGVCNPGKPMCKSCYELKSFECFVAMTTKNCALCEKCCLICGKHDCTQYRWKPWKI